jgi:translocator protein
MHNLRLLFVFIAIALGGGTLIGFSSMPGAWYEGLAKPPFNPPNWVFGPVWSVLYVLIGIAGARSFGRDKSSMAMRLWWAQMVLNFIWPVVFFTLQSPAAALVVILGLLAMIIGFVIQTWRADRLSAMLFLPYLAWVAFACLLNGAIWWLNA